MRAWTRLRSRFGGSAPAAEPVGRDVLKWVAAAFALVATATAEYEIARAIGMNTWVAAAVPGALDAYVVRALRTHREVLTAVLAMVGVNAASHLVTAGILPVEWPLITAVSAIAPLVLWRVHALGTPGDWRERKIWGLSKAEHAAVPASTDPEHTKHDRAPDNPEPPGTREHPEGCVHGHAECSGERACTVYRSVHSIEHAAVHAWTSGLIDTTIACTECGVMFPDVPDLEAHQRDSGHGVLGRVHAAGTDGLDVPEWVNPPSTPPVPEHAPYVDHVLLPDLPSTRPTPARHLEIVHEHTASTRTAEDWNLEHVSTGVLEPDDTVHMERARELYHTIGDVPPFRALKEGEPGMGTPRAQRIRAALKIENEGTE